MTQFKEDPKLIFKMFCPHTDLQFFKTCSEQKMGSICPIDWWQLMDPLDFAVPQTPRNPENQTWK